MTDIPPGTGRPDEEDDRYVPSGLRRSTFTPPPDGAEPPSFDDDALADALAAQVAPYTSPIPIVPPTEDVEQQEEPSGADAVPPAGTPERPASPFDEPAADDNREPATDSDGETWLAPPVEPGGPVWDLGAPPPQEPGAATVDTPSVAEPPSVSEPLSVSEPPLVAEPASVAEPTAEVDAPTTGSSTLEQIERLEQELRRRAGGETAPAEAEPAEPPTAAEPPTVAAPDPFAPESTAEWHDPRATPTWDAPPPAAGAPTEPGAPTIEGFPPADAAWAPPPGPPAWQAPPPSGEAIAPPPFGDVVAAPEPTTPPESTAIPEPAAPPSWGPPEGEPLAPAVDGTVPPPSAPESAAPAMPEAMESAPADPAGPESPAPESAAFDLPAPESAAFEMAAPEPTPADDAILADAPPPEESAALPGVPPPLVEPPPFPPPAAGAEPPAALVDLPPPTTGPIEPGRPPEFADVDVSQLPPPVGMEPAALPPYRPEDDVPGGSDGPAAPPPPDDAIPVFDSLLGFDSDDAEDADVDAVDRVGAAPVLEVDSTGSVDVATPLSRPVPTVRMADDDTALDPRPTPHPVFTVETAGPEPTALDLRAGRAARLFWLWFATTSSLLSLTVGATLFELGLSLRQAIVAALAGVAISFLPLGLGTLAGKWSGQPTLVVSRATFGLVGNIVPTIIALISRAFWGGALLWMLAVSVGAVLEDAGLDAGLGAGTWSLVGLGAGFAIAAAVSVVGYGLLARVQLVLSIAAGILVAGAIALTWDRVDLDAALTVGDGPWILVATGAVLVFSFVGLAWVHSTGDVARYQRTGSSGGASMLWAAFGATLPAFALIAWGAVLAASDPVLAFGLASEPLRTVAALLPLWYPVPLLLAAGIGLISGAALTMYSGGLVVQALGLRLRRPLATLLAAVVIAATAAALLVLVPDARSLVADVATTIAVPVAAWAGIFSAEMMIRSRRFHSASLLLRGGLYPAVRVVNLVGLVVITAIGFGFTHGDLPWLAWQGFAFPLLGVDAADPIATGDLGVLLALGLGVLLPIVAGIPAVRRQEDELD